MSEIFSMALGQNSPAVKKAVASLPDPNQYFVKNNTATVKVAMYHKDHGISPLDRVDVMFKAELENEMDPRGQRHWVYQNMKALSVLPGNDPVEHGIVPVRFVKQKRTPITAGAQNLIRLFEVPHNEVDGTGPKGKIMKKDVMTYLMEEMELTEDEIEAKRKAATEPVVDPLAKARTAAKGGKKAAKKK